MHAQITSWLTVYKMNNQSSYIYRPADDSNPPLVFTQMFLRPKVTQSDLAAKGLHAYGQQDTAASNRRALPNSYTMPVRWRTSEQTGTGKKNEMNTQVEAITEVGGASGYSEQPEGHDEWFQGSADLVGYFRA